VVCLSLTLVNPAKTAAPIEMPFELRTWVGPGNHVLDGGPDAPWEGAILWGKRRLIVKYRNTAIVYTKVAEPIEMLFGFRTRLGTVLNHVLDGGPDIPIGRGNFGGKEDPIISIRTFCRQLCKNG